jgi:aspartate/methionine/tyrosine aminotransferase
MYFTPFKLERYFAQYEFNVQYTLCSSDCESVTIRDLLELEPDARARLEKHWLGYTESLGAPTLRAEIARVYESMQPEHILVHTGAEEAIFLFMHAALNAGDHVIAHAPCYQSLMEVAHSIGCEVSPWRARAENQWALDVDELRGLIKPNTRVIVVNTPHNPTGYLMPRADYGRVNEIAREHDIILFSDEVYRESEYDAARRLPSACDVNDNAVSLGVMSKTYGLPGLRIGWVATRHARVYERMAALKDYTTICNSAPSEFLAELALRHRAQLAQRNREIIARNLQLLDAFFAEYAGQLIWARPHAGPIAFPKLLHANADAFCHDLVTQKGVLLLPGSLFDDDAQPMHLGNHFRIGFGRKNMPEALARLQEFLQK